jgi:hypothetical protein
MCIQCYYIKGPLHASLTLNPKALNPETLNPKALNPETLNPREPRALHAPLPPVPKP